MLHWHICVCVCISFLYERITLKITSVCMSISFSLKYFVSLSPYFLSYLPVCLLVKTSFVSLCCLLFVLFFICIYISVSFLPLSYCLPNFLPLLLFLCTCDLNSNARLSVLSPSWGNKCRKLWSSLLTACRKTTREGKSNKKLRKKKLHTQNHILLLVSRDLSVALKLVGRLSDIDVMFRSARSVFVCTLS